MNDRDPDPVDGERLVRHERRLRLLISHWTGPALRVRLSAEDLVQEVYLRAWTAATRPPCDPDDPGDVAMWKFLRHLARNTIVDAARAARAAKRSGGVGRVPRTDWTRVGDFDPAARTPGPPTRLAHAEAQAQLEAAFDALSPEHRRVIGLRQIEGLSAAEAAARMGRSETAVHSLYRRALAAWAAASGVDERT